VNGKVRSKITGLAEWTKDDAVTMARSDDKTKEWLKDKTIKNIIFVPKKLLNFVTS